MTENIILKTCTKCKIEQPTTNFQREKRGKYGVAARCKKCVLEYERALRLKKLPPRAPDLPNEIWSAVVGFEEEYSVSNLGRVRREARASNTHPGKILKPYLTPDGRFTVALHQRTMLVHRIVAKAFLEPDDARPQVNHKNGIPTDNRVDNLEWATNAENCAHAAAVLKRSGARKLTEEKVKEIRDRYAHGSISQRKLANELGMNEEHIRNVINRVWWKHVD